MIASRSYAVNGIGDQGKSKITEIIASVWQTVFNGAKRKDSLTRLLMQFFPPVPGGTPVGKAIFSFSRRA
jgi:hypothetical protein